MISCATKKDLLILPSSHVVVPFRSVKMGNCCSPCNTCHADIAGKVMIDKGYLIEIVEKANGRK